MTALSARTLVLVLGMLAALLAGAVVFGLGAGSSGLALLAASSFGDPEYYDALRTTLEFAAFPAEEDGRLRYRASNIVGDAVLLYSMVTGPLWQAATIGGASP